MQDLTKFTSLIENTNPLIISKIFRNGWNIFKQNISGFVIYTILMSILLSLSALTGIGILLIGMPLLMGFYMMADNIHIGERQGFSTFFQGFKHFLPLFVYMLIFSLIVTLFAALALLVYSPTHIGEVGTSLSPSDRGFLLPFLLLIEFLGNLINVIVYLLIPFIPLTYLAIAFGFAPMLIVFEGLSTWTAMKISWKLMHKKWLKVMLAYILLLIIGLSGSLIYLIGAIFTLPLAYCMHYALYRELIPFEPKL